MWDERACQLCKYHQVGRAKKDTIEYFPPGIIQLIRDLIEIGKSDWLLWSLG